MKTLDFVIWSISIIYAKHSHVLLLLQEGLHYPDRFCNDDDHYYYDYNNDANVSHIQPTVCYYMKVQQIHHLC